MIRHLCVRWFKKMGWRFVGTVPRREKGVVLVVGPQSSWRDLIIAIAIKRITYLNADLLIHPSAWTWKSRYLLQLSGATKWSGNNDEETAARILKRLSAGEKFGVVFPFNALNNIHLHPVTDFYPIAVQSKCSVVLVALDHRRKVVKFHNPFFLSGYHLRDMSYINGFFSNYYRHAATNPIG